MDLNSWDLFIYLSFIEAQPPELSQAKVALEKICLLPNQDR